MALLLLPNRFGGLAPRSESQICAEPVSAKRVAMLNTSAHTAASRLRRVLAYAKSKCHLWYHISVDLRSTLFKTRSRSPATGENAILSFDKGHKIDCSNVFPHGNSRNSGNLGEKEEKVGTLCSTPVVEPVDGPQLIGDCYII